MVELEVLGVRIDLPDHQPVLLLKEVGGARLLPVWIGAADAAAVVEIIESADRHQRSVHSILINLARSLHMELAARITGFDEGVFRGELQVGSQVYECRPSDLARICLLGDVSLHCPASLMAEVGVEPSKPPEDEVERFREFLDQVSPDDFQG